MRTGIPISPGVAVARAFRLEPGLARAGAGAAGPLDVAALAAEAARFDAACVAVAAELDATVERVRGEVGEQAAAIFVAHRAILRDPGLASRVHAAILERRLDAVSALAETLAGYEALFAQIRDDYLRERVADIRDVIGRVAARVGADEPRAPLGDGEPVVLVAHEILPSQAVMFEQARVQAIVTESGGGTGHAAILARAMGIPAVSGLAGLMRDARAGDLVAVDGRSGHVHLNPGPEVEAAYRKLRREYVDLRDKLVENRDQPAVTGCGTAIELLVNANSAADAAAAGRVGATGVGLFRTEFLFLTHSSVPDEAEQFAAYRAVVEAAPNRRVTIRTLDLGGDKQVPYLGDAREANPFMGWRSIRLTSAYPEFFQTQLRAILRAAVGAEVSLLFPMVSTVEEVVRLKRLVERARLALRAERVPFNERVPVGVMIEVPAAALCVDQILEEADFISIGTNDLIQYVMAADRDNPKVAHLCEPFQPAVLRLLRAVARTCADRGKPATLCGEMAGRPRCLLPLLGMGLRRFSMSPGFVPAAKETVRAIRREDALQAAERVVRMRTAGEVRDYLGERVRALCPRAALVDTA